MKVTKFWAQNYRSLRDISLELGEFNIFYGQNGSGKSNVLDALQAFFCLAPFAADSAYGTADDERLSFRAAGQLALRYICDDDFLHTMTRKLSHWAQS